MNGERDEAPGLTKDQVSDDGALLSSLKLLDALTIRV